MPVSRLIPLLLLAALLAMPGLARAQGFMAVDQAPEAARRGCLNRTEQRAAVGAHKAVALGAAIKSLRERGGLRGEIVHAELCNRNEKLVYVLTLLARSGKVTRASVDAANGEPINGQ